MKRSWTSMLAWIAVACLLWILPVEARMNPASSYEKHSVAWPRDARSPSSCQSLRVLSGGWIRGRAGPQEFLFTDVLVLLRCAADLDLVAPPWLESARRVDIGTLGDPLARRSRKSRQQL